MLRRSAAIIGVDEVGRGSLVGPVVVCAARFERIPRSARVRDSKLLTARQRREVALWLRQVCPAWVVVEVWQETIDRLNILEATRLAMTAAVRALAAPDTEVVVDQVTLGDLGLPVHSPVRADRDYFTVAAASILAKVHRDRVLAELAADDDRWDWSRNMGYGTVEHRRAVERWGRSYLHRQSFRVSRVLP
ncbi:MAG: ribonuclease HII [Thermoanaerobaculales bacterium]|nr:ribonuclease HII [Thermoanaerobaculales bacterium]